MSPTASYTIEAGEDGFRLLGLCAVKKLGVSKGQKLDCDDEIYWEQQAFEL